MRRSAIHDHSALGLCRNFSKWLTSLPRFQRSMAVGQLGKEEPLATPRAHTSQGRRLKNAHHQSTAEIPRVDGSGRTWKGDGRKKKRSFGRRGSTSLWLVNPPNPIMNQKSSRAQQDVGRASQGLWPRDNSEDRRALSLPANQEGDRVAHRPSTSSGSSAPVVRAGDPPVCGR